MRLLFDANLSPALCGRLASVFPESIHVSTQRLGSASDADVWEFARARDLTIVSKDSDFHQRSLLYGAPPKVVWIRIGNCSTSDIERLLRRHAAALGAFERDAEAAFLELGD